MLLITRDLRDSGKIFGTRQAGSGQFGKFVQPRVFSTHIWNRRKTAFEKIYLICCPFSFFSSYSTDRYIEKSSALNETHKNGFVHLKKLPNELKGQKKPKFKYTEPLKVLHLDTLSETSPQNLKRFRTKTTKRKSFALEFTGFIQYQTVLYLITEI